MQIKKEPYLFEDIKLLNIYESLDSDQKQICFTDRPDHHSIEDGTGSLFDYHPCNEMDWTELNPLFHNTYLEEIYNLISEEYVIGRSRFMVMDKTNRALSYHYDDGLRLHIPLQTNPHAWFINAEQELIRMDELGRLYSLDAKQYHSALNLDRNGTPRIHIVFSVEKKLK
jgi:hypothetical protein